MKSVLTHIYNEEYLLPWWLEHHKKMFDYGVIIDYGSTDRSVEICKEICPHWQVLPSKYTHFDAVDCDYEIMFYESQIPDWRITLTAAEFLVGDIDSLTNNRPERQQHIIPGIRFTKWDPCGKLDRSKPLWEQVHTGISYYDNHIAHQARSLHEIRSKITGRVYWILPSMTRKPQERQIVIEIANEFHDTVIDRPKEMSPDGIHPTMNGYKELASKTK